MQVKCDRCGQSYEVNDSRISPQGAKIKCPSCANIFVVRPAKNAAAAQDPAPNPNDSAVKLQTPIKPKSAAADSKPETPKVEEDEWRIQNMGLTYTFHDLESLHNWLAGRPALDGVKIARNKDDWKELGDYPDVMTTELITKFFPLGDVPTSQSVNAAKSDGTVDKTGTLNGSKLGTLNGGKLGTLNGGKFGTLNGATPSIVTDPLLSASSLSPISSSPISKATDLSTAVTSKSSMQQLKKERAKAKQAKQDSQKQLIAFGIIIALLVVVGIFVVRYWRTGEIPFVETQAPVEKPVVQNDTPEPEQPVVQQPVKDEVPPPPPVVENKISYDEIERLAEQDYQRQLGEARDMVNKRKWPEARATLESMYLEHTDDPELLQLLAKTYRGLNMGEKANAMDAAAKKALAAKKELEKKQADAIHIGDE